MLALIQQGTRIYVKQQTADDWSEIETMQYTKTLLVAYMETQHKTKLNMHDIKKKHLVHLEPDWQQWAIGIY